MNRPLDTLFLMIRQKMKHYSCTDPLNPPLRIWFLTYENKYYKEIVYYLLIEANCVSYH